MVLNETYRLLLHAAFDDGESAAAAYRRWRECVPLDDLTFASLRILGQVVQTAYRNGVADSELARIRGAVKHTWMRNMLRNRALAQALRAIERSGAQVMVVKGAALMARYPKLTGIHAPADFDAIVRADDIRQTVAAMLEAKFRTVQARLDLFGPSDFDKIHALTLHHGEKGESIDFHWWPLPSWTHEAFLEELFARSESASYSGIAVRVPSLEDHIYLTLARPEVWDQDEMLARMTEALHLLRNSSGRIDWARVIALCRQFHKNAIALSILDLLKTDFGAPVPSYALCKLRETCSHLSSWEYRISRRRDVDRTPREKFIMQAIALIRSNPGVTHSLTLTTLRLLRSREFRHQLTCAAQVTMPTRSAEHVWRRHVKNLQQFSPHELSFGAGFSLPEAEGRWTDGYSAVLALPVADRNRARIRISLWAPLTSAKPTATVETCTGVGLTATKTFTFADRIPTDLVVEADIIRESAFSGAIIAFRLLDPVRPWDFGVSNDTRRLGVFIRSVALMP
jgi:hypothetical protein